MNCMESCELKYELHGEHCVRPRTLIEQFFHSPLYTENEQSLVCGTAVVEAWVY